MATLWAPASARNRSAARSRSSTVGALRADARPMRNVELAFVRAIAPPLPASDDRPGGSAAPVAPAGDRRAGLLDHGAGRRHEPRDPDLLAVDHRRDLGRDLVLPVIALVHGVVEALALRLALEATEPDV